MEKWWGFSLSALELILSLICTLLGVSPILAGTAVARPIGGPLGSTGRMGGQARAPGPDVPITLILMPTELPPSPWTTRSPTPLTASLSSQSSFLGWVID